MTAIAVISDTMVLPFYPRLLAVRFGISSSVVAGLYLASLSLVVMAALPLWARLARRIDTLRMLIWTQLAATVLSVGCYYADSVTGFWLFAVTMVAFKASYLLMYPFVMRMDDKTHHAITIGALTVIVHFGSVSGAMLGASLIKRFDYAVPFLVMAVGDVIQILMCLLLLRRRRNDASFHEVVTEPVRRSETGTRQFAYLLVAMLAFYFSVYLPTPFMVAWWQSIVPGSSQLVAGLIYVIPGFVALLMLLYGHVQKSAGTAWNNNQTGLLLICFGLALQAVPNALTLVFGRIVFGIGLYQVTIGLDALFFATTNPADYDRRFGTVNIARSCGIILAAVASGVITERFGPGISIALACRCVALTLVLYRLVLKLTIPATSAQLQPA